MDDRPQRVLILDTDADMLITLQHLLEDVGVDATITWDGAEAGQLIQSKSFDLILVGDHPPELDAATILRDVSSQGTSYPSLVLRGVVRETDIQRFREFGAINVVAKRDFLAVLEEVTKALAPMPFKVAPAKAGRAIARSWRAAS
jgi:CheY-like chemotaxis protein